MMTAGPTHGKPRPRPSRALLLLLAAATACLLMQQTRCRAPLGAGQPAQHPGRVAAKDGAVLPPHHAGVVRYSIPGQFEKSPPATDAGPRTGTLHIYLKALRWPVGNSTYHLRLKGFVAFEPTVHPEHWKGNMHLDGLDTFFNVPEVAARLRLLLRSVSGRWERPLSLAFSQHHCELFPPWGQRTGSEADYRACLAAAATLEKPAHSLADVSVDLGPTTATDYELLVEGWPRRVALKAQLQAALAAPPAAPTDAAPPQLFRSLPTSKAPDALIRPAKLAQLLGWGDDYYKPLGLAGTYLYVLPGEVAELVVQPAVQQLLAAQRLMLIEWDQFSWYKGWTYYDQQIVQSHSVLSLWGSHARLLVLDADEFLAPATPRLSLPQMLAPGGCLAQQRPECLMFFRQDIYTAQRPLDKPSVEPGWWSGGARPNPLPRYKHVSQQPRLPKVMVDPTDVLPLMVHYTAICDGQSEPAGAGSNDTLRSACDTLAPCTWVPQDCATIYHVPNMHAARAQPINATPIHPPNWLWMLNHRK